MMFREWHPRSQEKKAFQERRCNIQFELLFKAEENEVLELTLGFSNVEDIGDLDKCSLAEVVGKKVWSEWA